MGARLDSAGPVRENESPITSPEVRQERRGVAFLETFTELLTSPGNELQAPWTLP